MNLLRRVEGEVLERLGRVSVVARQAVESLLSGQHHSIHRGLSVEFAGHRPYAPGDDPRRIDWLVYARTDRHEVRLYEEEARLNALIVLDVSGSMAYGGKLDRACLLAAALEALMMRRGDQVGLALVDTALRLHLPPMASMPHLLRLLEALEKLRPAGETALGPVLETLALRLRRRGLVLLISDGLDDPERLGRALRHLRHRRQEVRLVQVLDPDELAFPLRGQVLLAGLEGEPSLGVDADRLRDRYRTAVAAHQQGLMRACRESGATWDLCRADEDPVLFLGRMLAGGP